MHIINFSWTNVRLVPPNMALNATVGRGRAIASGEAFLPLATILHIIHLEPGRYRAWRRAERACELTDTALLGCEQALHKPSAELSSTTPQTNPLLSRPNSKYSLPAMDGDSPAQRKYGKPSSKSLLVILTAIITAVPPLTVAVHGWIAKARDIELAERSRAKDIDMAERDYAFRTQSWFLQNAVDPQKTPELRQQVLRFIKNVPGDKNLVSWATEELSRVDEVIRLSRELKAKEDELLLRNAEVAQAKAEGRAVLQRAIADQKQAEKEATQLRRQLALKGNVPTPVTDKTTIQFRLNSLIEQRKALEGNVPERRGGDETAGR
jgi:hypothetical protein